MSWIDIIPYRNATGKLRKLYDRIKGADDNVDNVMLIHGLRPHSLEGHMVLYKSVLHHGANSVPKWLLETLGVYTSVLNRCDYCVAHHTAGLARLLDDPPRAQAIRAAFEADELPSDLDDRARAALHYARKLTHEPSTLTRTDIDALRTAGWNDGEILEINQVVAYFAYANRTVLGLGVSTDGDILGLSPSGDDWQHR
ncbi:MAG: peroxidase-related enzyme [Acidobacteriota bacterium]